MPLSFLPTRRFIQLPDRIQSPSASVGLVQWVLARSLYRLQLISLPQVAKAEQLNAAVLQAKRQAPYANPGVSAGQAKGHDRVWVATWDADVVQEAQRASGVFAEGEPMIAPVPESFLQTAHTGFDPRIDNAVLRQTLAGIEGQVWREGEWIASQLWPAMPTQHAWQLFCREHRVADELGSQLPTVLASPLERHPPRTLKLYSPKASSGDSGTVDARWVRPAVTLGAAALSLATIAYAVRYWQAGDALNRRLAAIEAQRKAIEPIAAKRVQAQTLAAEIETINALEPFEAMSHLLQEVSVILPKDGTYITDWQYNQGSLKLVMAAGTTQRPVASFVESLQATGFFTEVRASGTQPRQGYSLEMRVVPGKFKPAVATASTAPATGAPR